MDGPASIFQFPGQVNGQFTLFVVLGVVIVLTFLIIVILTSRKFLAAHKTFTQTIVGTRSVLEGKGVGTIVDNTFTKICPSCGAEVQGNLTNCSECNAKV